MKEKGGARISPHLHSDALSVSSRRGRNRLRRKATCFEASISIDQFRRIVTVPITITIVALISSEFAGKNFASCSVSRKLKRAHARSEQRS